LPAPACPADTSAAKSGCNTSSACSILARPPAVSPAPVQGAPRCPTPPAPSAPPGRPNAIRSRQNLQSGLRGTVGSQGVAFVSHGSKEKTATAKPNHEALEKKGIQNIYYESPDPSHEWQSRRRSLYQLEPQLFRD